MLPERQNRRGSKLGWMLLAGLVLAAGCNEETTGPVDTALSGTYSGEFVDNRLGTIPAGTLQVNQSGSSITGTIDAGRPANFSGTLNDEDKLQGTMTITGDCPGTGTINGDFTEGNRILGGYQGTDCQGAFSGTFSVVRQT